MGANAPDVHVGKLEINRDRPPHVHERILDDVLDCRRVDDDGHSSLALLGACREHPVPVIGRLLESAGTAAAFFVAGGRAIGPLPK